MRGSKDAPRDPLSGLERLHGLAVIFERGAGVCGERPSVNPPKLKRERPTHNQATPSRFPNVDVHAILFALIMIVFVFYPLAQMALGL